MYPDQTDQLLGMTADIVAAHVGKNNVAIGDVAGLITTVHGALASLGEPEALPTPAHEPAVTARKSLADPNHIVSMIDGRQYKMLKRHLANHGLTPDQYRARYELPADYPMTAKAYSETRRSLAIAIGLGKKA